MRLGAAKPLEGRHVLALVAAFFAAILAVNGVMVWLALGSFPGMVSPDAYREGLAYNRTLAAREAQRALGWRVQVDATGQGLSRRLEARFADRDGSPLRGLDVAATLKRPVTRGADQAIEFAEILPGVYRAEVEFPLPGHWQLELEARSGATEWKMERELWLN
jgi:nitrogen fixation protein FixH